MRTIDYPKARNRPQPAGSNRRVDLAMRPAAKGRICPGIAKEGWGRMERKGTLGKEGARRESTQGGSGPTRRRSLLKVERARCDRESILKVKPAHMPARYQLIENRASCRWPWTEAPVHFSLMRQRRHPATLVWIQFARLLTFRQKQPNTLQQQQGRNPQPIIAHV